MIKRTSIQEFYVERYKWIPNELRANLGHFNVFPLEPPAIGTGAKDLPYGRREWYNIVLVFGGGVLQSAEGDRPVKDYAITFNGPYMPFGWKDRHQITKGYYCIFNEEFLRGNKRIVEFPPLNSTNPTMYDLMSDEAEQAEQIFLRMSAEISSEYTYKYDVAKILVEELLHITMKSHNFDIKSTKSQNASERHTIQFLELLERQFPIDENSLPLKYFRASDFAELLSVHVNHLNRSVKTSTGKTTTQIIKERIAQEAKILLQQTDWNISEIAYSLGFNEATHFNNFFKKSTKLNPTEYKNLTT